MDPTGRGRNQTSADVHLKPDSENTYATLVKDKQ
jgi:hypothetical protein